MLNDHPLSRSQTARAEALTIKSGCCYWFPVRVDVSVMVNEHVERLL